VTGNLPRSIKPSGALDRPAPHTRARSANRTKPAAINGADPTASTALARKTRSLDASHDKALVLRPDFPPVSQLDFDDRHDTRATESEEMAQRYAELRKDRRRNDWHYLAMGLAVFLVGVAVYLAGFVFISRLLPQLNLRQVTHIVGLAFVVSGGGIAVRAVGRTLKQRYVRPQDRDSR
jgi:hypothetical protein